MCVRERFFGFYCKLNMPICLKIMLGIRRINSATYSIDRFSSSHKLKTDEHMCFNIPFYYTNFNRVGFFPLLKGTKKPSSSVESQFLKDVRPQKIFLGKNK